MAGVDSETVRELQSGNKLAANTKSCHEKQKTEYLSTY
jgi:hypothetical protein